MALKIRLRQQGQKNRPFYRVVVADAAAPREGRYLENVGWYNPIETDEAQALHLEPERIERWIHQGAQITDGVFPLIKKGAPAIIQLLQEQKKRKQTKRRSERKSSPRNSL